MPVGSTPWSTRPGEAWLRETQTYARARGGARLRVQNMCVARAIIPSALHVITDALHVITDATLVPLHYIGIT